MGSWRRHRGENHHQEVHGRRWQSRKPPLGPWQPTVASWEKNFCVSVGSVSWRKLIETQRFKYIYKNVMNWDDSAIEEAFHSAKRRFWAQINGLPCDISLPGPDIYIDEIDWDSIIDPELILDLEREPKICDQTDNGEHVIIFGDSFFQEHYSLVPVIGWGPEENYPNPTNYELDPQLGNENENVDGSGDLLSKNYNESKKNVDCGTRWEISWNSLLEQNGLENNSDLLNKYHDELKNMDHGTGQGHSWSGSWEQNQLENNTDLLNRNSNESKNVCHGAGGEVGYVWNDSWRQNQLENNGDVWNKNYDEPKNVGRGTDGDWGMWDRDGNKREGTGWKMSRYETSQCHGNYYKRDRGWRNGRWPRKLNFAYEQPHRNQVPHANQWTEVNYYRPVNQSHRWESRNPMQF